MKLRYDLIPVDALKEVARVLALGEEKHKGNNFRDVHLEHNQHIASAFRHGEAYRGGEMMDTEMGTHHLAHRIVRDLYQMQIDMEHKMSDYLAEKAYADAEKAWEKQCQEETLKEAIEARNQSRKDAEEARKQSEYYSRAKVMAPCEAGILSLNYEVGDGDA